MNYYGNSGYSHQQQQQQHNQQQHNQQQQRNDYYSATPSYAASISDQSAQHPSHVKLQQTQTVFHCRVRDMYFSSWQGQQNQQQNQQLQLQQQHSQQPESVWQGHKNPRVYLGEEVHCFNTYCQTTFRNSQMLVAHILRGECGEITMDEVSCLVRDWKALQIELGRLGKLTVDEISCLERAWELLQTEQAKSGKITRELIGFLVLAWEILSGNRMVLETEDHHKDDMDGASDSAG
ncbi:hypothetical protein AXG93_606s1240 [Marchantia polymorpha subsp. ruderalis]|uniref:Uncharacterized protein n=1 Tax=Marchantia polymorpha subsp. ruderalis TaxID=1480154 RepID=A0A176VJA4_MARPO|nr:hypothetical protein AXG93_606s1240 [Marchantia polymorpha subsp. ruderalis]